MGFKNSQKRMNHEEVLVQNAGSESKHRSPKDQQAVKRTPGRVTSAREYTRSGLTGKLYLVQSAQNEPPEDTAGSLRDSEEATNERVIPLLTIRNSVFDNSSFNALPPPRHQVQYEAALARGTVPIIRCSGQRQRRSSYNYQDAV